MDQASKRVMSLEIKTNYTCNTRCSYCCAYNNWHKPILNFDGIVANIQYFRAEYDIEEICLSGGEPTIHPDFKKTLNFAREMKLRVYLHTNAITFANQAFAEHCRGQIDRALIGFSYHNESLCAALTGTAKTFARRLKGIANLQAADVPLRTNTVILRENLSSLPEIARVIVGLGVDRALFTLPFFFSASLGQVSSFVPEDWAEVKNQLTLAIKLLREAEIEVSLQGLPPCKLGEFSDFYEIDPDRVFVDVEHQFERHSLLFSGMLGYRQLDCCVPCQFSPKCWGFPSSQALGVLGDSLGLT